MKNYVLALVFDHTFEYVLLMNRKQEPYTGKLNGIGGKIEDGETPLEAINREYYEETNYEPIHLKFLLTCTFPDEHLHVFYGSIKKQEILVKENHEGIYDWYKIENSFFDVNNDTLAGGGNLPYFIKFALDTKNGK